MSRQEILESRMKELTTRRQRLSELLEALQQQGDLETRVEEKMRLTHLIRERETERQQVESQLQQLEEEFRVTHETPRSPVHLSPASPKSLPTSIPIKPGSPVRIFYSYSHKDEELREQLETCLKLLQRQGVITPWHDRKINPGDNWKGAIDENLQRADLILLLVSADFIASDYCYEIEMQTALEQDERGEARIVPIILRPCLWRDAPFGKLQALPKAGKPVTSWANRDEAWTDVAEGLKKVVEEIHRKRVEG